MALAVIMGGSGALSLDRLLARGGTSKPARIDPGWGSKHDPK